MTKKIIFLLALMLIFTSLCAYGADTYKGYNYPVDIDVNGSFIKCTEKPIIIDGTTYIPLRAFSDAVGGTTNWNEEDMSATVEKDGHTFVFYIDKDFSLIDGVKTNHKAVLHSDVTFVPVRALSEVLGYDVVWDKDYLTVKITAPGVTVPDNLKDTSYTYEDIKYLGKITQIESGYQHFQVRLGVAATVMNRVRSSQFPNTVKDVIFDTRYSTQFPPAHTEKFTNLEPSTETLIAAKCALHGVNLVGNSMYFVDTAYTSGSWVHNNRPHYVTLHDMSFYE